MPPNAAIGGQNGAQQNSAQAPLNFPTAAGNEPSSNSLGDRAWTSTPSPNRASGRVGDAPQPAAYPSPVVPAQFTSQPVTSHQAPGSTGQANPGSPAVRSASSNLASSHEPRPLKPPSSTESKAGSKGSTGTVQMFVSVLSSLAIVIGLILAAAWFYSQSRTEHQRGICPNKLFKYSAAHRLRRANNSCYCDWAPNWYWLAIFHGDVRTISEITDPLEVDRLSGLCEAAQPGSISESFRSVLHNMGRNGMMPR